MSGWRPARSQLLRPDHAGQPEAPSEDARRTALAAIAAWQDGDSQSLRLLLRHEADPVPLLACLAGMASSALTGFSEDARVRAAFPEQLREGLRRPVA
jgi:hypothetical protein